MANPLKGGDAKPRAYGGNAKVVWLPKLRPLPQGSDTETALRVPYTERVF